MSLATSAPGHRTRPASPTTPTPTERNGTSVSGLQRSYAMIFSPEDQGIAPDLSPSLSVSSMDTESASEHIPQATLRMYNLFHGDRGFTHVGGRSRILIRHSYEHGRW